MRAPTLLVALWSAKMDAVTLRPVGPWDEGARYALFFDVRAEELGIGAWEPPLRDLVLRQQFDAQRSGHRAEQPAAGEFLILVDDTPAGWTVLDRTGATLALRRHRDYFRIPPEKNRDARPSKLSAGSGR
jgi:hypothetical protein